VPLINEKSPEAMCTPGLRNCQFLIGRETNVSNSEQPTPEDQEPLVLPFCSLESVLCDPETTDAEFRLLSHIVRLADHRGIAFVPILRLENITGRSRRWVQLTLKRLVERGIVVPYGPAPSRGQPRRLSLTWASSIPRSGSERSENSSFAKELSSLETKFSLNEKIKRKGLGANSCAQSAHDFAPKTQICAQRTVVVITANGQKLNITQFAEYLQVIQKIDSTKEQRNNAIARAGEEILRVFAIDRQFRAAVYGPLQQVRKQILPAILVLHATMAALQDILIGDVIHHSAKCWYAHIKANRERFQDFRNHKNKMAVTELLIGLENSVKAIENQFGVKHTINGDKPK
jgi:hypothetical protein